jgi:hypothetical protein
MSKKLMQDNIIQMDKNNASPALHSSSVAWANAGIEILIASNIEAVTMEMLCLRMNASKDQFHEIFKGISEFHQMMLDVWYERQTLAFVAAVEEGGARGKEALIYLLRILEENDKTEEIAIRNWALQDQNAYKTLVKVDRTRVDHCAGLMQEMGISSRQAIFRSKLIYSAHIGLEYSTLETNLEEMLKALDLVTGLSG